MFIARCRAWRQGLGAPVRPTQGPTFSLLPWLQACSTCVPSTALCHSCAHQMGGTAVSLDGRVGLESPDTARGTAWGQHKLGAGPAGLLRRILRLLPAQHPLWPAQEGAPCWRAQGTSPHPLSWAPATPQSPLGEQCHPTSPLKHTEFVRSPQHRLQQVTCD